MESQKRSVQQGQCDRCGRLLPLGPVIDHLVICRGVQPGSVVVEVWALDFSKGLPATAPQRLAEGLLFSPEEFCLYVAGELVRLPGREGRLLRFLVESEGRVVTREHILDGVWGSDAEREPGIVDTYISRLRRLLERHPDGRQLIETIRGVGYRFRRLS